MSVKIKNFQSLKNFPSTIRLFAISLVHLQLNVLVIRQTHCCSAKRARKPWKFYFYLNFRLVGCFFGCFAVMFLARSLYLSRSTSDRALKLTRQQQIAKWKPTLRKIHISLTRNGELCMCDMRYNIVRVLCRSSMTCSLSAGRWDVMNFCYSHFFLSQGNLISQIRVGRLLEPQQKRETDKDGISWEQKFPSHNIPLLSLHSE